MTRNGVTGSHEGLPQFLGIGVAARGLQGLDHDLCCAKCGAGKGPGFDLEPLLKKVWDYLPH